MPELTILPAGKRLTVKPGTNLRQAILAAGVWLDSPCGGRGTCGKCGVRLNGQSVLACQTVIREDASVELPEAGAPRMPPVGAEMAHRSSPAPRDCLIAADIGTTSVVCLLLDGATGETLAAASMLNPQTAFGADVISRIQAALSGALEQERDMIRAGLTELIRTLCAQAYAAPEDIRTVSVVGNPAMQQLFLGIPPKNLASAPFPPVLTAAETLPCRDILPVCPNAALLTVPDIGGYVGADTVACVLATGLYDAGELTLMVDIGTNGEMVLGGRRRMVACSAAAGPALEGANIRFGMRGAAGAIDHVWLENGALRYSVIGGGRAAGICGSGLIDAVAVLAETGQINRRGRLQTKTERDGQRAVELTEDIFLTQEDIRQVQLAKGAIHAGIELMARQMDIEIGEIRQVLLAGAFGSYMDPVSACRIGLLPPELEGRTRAVGNAALSGAALLARDPGGLALSQQIRDRTQFLELASLPEFPGVFARCMGFCEVGT